MLSSEREYKSNFKIFLERSQYNNGDRSRNISSSVCYGAVSGNWRQQILFKNSNITIKQYQTAVKEAAQQQHGAQ